MARLMDLPDSKGKYGFQYKNSARTDLVETFKRERARLDALEAEAREDVATVTQIKRRSKK